MTTRTTVAQLADARDLDLGASDWMRVDQRRIDGFAEMTEDRQWIHVDADRAADGPFGTTIAHGYLTLSLIPHLLAQLLQVTDEVRGTNYGIDRVRFTGPVKVDSEIRLAATVVHGRRRPDGGVAYTVGITVEVRGEDRPALVGETVYLSYDR